MERYTSNKNNDALYFVEVLIKIHDEASPHSTQRLQTPLVYEQVAKPMKRDPDNPRMPCVTRGLRLLPAGLKQWKLKLEWEALPINQHNNTRRLKDLG